MFYFQVINSVLVPTVDEETLLARIIVPEPEYQREGSTSDRWNYWLNVKQKKIWWKELYESDVAARKFTKTKDREKVTIVEGSSSNSGLESMLKGVEERIMKAMEEGFSGINLTVETKLEAMNLRMGKLEKYQRVLKKKAKKIEDKLTSIESKGNENEEYTQWNDFDYGRDHGKDRDMAEAEKDETGKKINEEEEKDQEPEKDKENSDSVEKGEEYVEESDEENSPLRLQERVRVQAEEFWRTIDDESEAEEEVEKEGEEEVEKEGEEEGEKEVIVITPRGRTKAAAARKAISISPEIVMVTGIAELAEKEVEVEATHTEQEAIQTEIVEKEAEVTEKDVELAEKEDQDVDEEEEKAEESDKNPDVDQDMEEEEEKAERLAKMRAEAEKKKARAEKKKAKADGAPKKKGRPKKTEATLKPCTPLPEKRKSEPSRWVQSPFTEGKTDELEVPKKKLKTKT
ncbi:hypothetical protein Bca101_069754 [Brassica carinata]